MINFFLKFSTEKNVSRTSGSVVHIYKLSTVETSPSREVKFYLTWVLSVYKSKQTKTMNSGKALNNTYFSVTLVHNLQQGNGWNGIFLWAEFYWSGLDYVFFSVAAGVAVVLILREFES